MRKSDVVQHFGTQAAVARELGIGRAAINKWPELVPESWAALLHVRTDGRLKYDRAAYLASVSAAQSPQPVAR